MVKQTDQHISTRQIKSVNGAGFSMEDVIAILPNVLKQFPLIEAAYIFGSMASGKNRASSDLDLGIMPRSPQIHTQKLDILYELTRAGFKNVDLVFLDTDDIVLKYEAIYQNKLVYQTKGYDRGTIHSLIIRQYLDFVPFLETQREAYKRRLLNGTA